MTPKERHVDIQNLKKYPEFYAFKMELEKFCSDLESMHDIKLDEVSRLTLAEEVGGRIWAAEKVKDLLSTLGLIDKSKPRTVDRTME